MVLKFFTPSGLILEEQWYAFVFASHRFQLTIFYCGCFTNAESLSLMQSVWIKIKWLNLPFSFSLRFWNKWWFNIHKLHFLVYCLGLRDVIYLSFQPYLQISSYGKGFVKASQDTWELFERQEMEPIVDSDITSSICFLTGVCSGSICVIVVAAWTARVHQSFTATISLLAFFIGYLMVGSLHWPIILYLIRSLYIQIMWSTWSLFNCY